MIDRIAPTDLPVLAPAATGGLSALQAGGALIDRLTDPAGPVGVPIRALAGAVAGALSPVGNPVGAARLDAAVLDFARDAKAFAIGHADRGGDSVRAALQGALNDGAAAADRISSPTFDGLDRVVSSFEHATARLASA